MDPNSALQQLIESVATGDIDRTEDLIAAINGWTACGGFPPDTIGPRSLGTIWHLAVTKAVLKIARAHVRVVANKRGTSHVP